MNERSLLKILGNAGYKYETILFLLTLGILSGNNVICFPNVSCLDYVNLT